MSWQFNLTDGTGSGLKQRINDDNAAYTTQIPYPPLIKQKTQPFKQFLTDDGLATGSNDMGIDGSTTVTDFFIPADNEDDRYVTELNFLIGYGGSAQPYQFADGAALATGIRIFYTNEQGEKDIAISLKANQDLLRLRKTGVDTNWELRGINTLNDYGFFFTIDLTRFSPVYGIKLDAGSSQKLIVRIQDNVGATADALNAEAIGFDRF